MAPLYIYLIRDISFIADLGDLRRQPLYLLGCRPIPTPDLGFKTPTSTPSSTLFMHPSASLEPIDLCDRCHLFAYHSTSHVTLDILDTRCIFVASATLHVAYQIGRLPFICKGCCPLVAYFSKILYITSFLRVRARDCTRSIGGGGPGIGVFRDTSSDSGRVWVVAEVLAAGRGVGAHYRLRVAVCSAARRSRLRVGDWPVWPSQAVHGACVPGTRCKRGPPSGCVLAPNVVVCLRGRKRTTADHLFCLVCLSMWYETPLVFFSRKPGAFHLCYTVYVRVI